MMSEEVVKSIAPGSTKGGIAENRVANTYEIADAENILLA
jgi:hypothetical protein